MLEPVTEPVRRLIAKYENRIERLEKANGRLCRLVNGDVVLCRDCVHFTPKGTYKFANGKTNDDYCKFIRGWLLQITPYDFCSRGERKEGGE